MMVMITKVKTIDTTSKGIAAQSKDTIHEINTRCKYIYRWKGTGL